MRASKKHAAPKVNEVRLLHGDCLEQLRVIESESIDAVVTDPPYEIGFIDKAWDRTGIAYSVELWRECLRVLKPGGHLLAFGATRTYHRIAGAIEKAGFEIRDSIHWIYGNGFPHGIDVSKAIDREAGAERRPTGIRKRSPKPGVTTFGKSRREFYEVTEPATPEAFEWEGWSTTLKPAHEPIVVARKPLAERTVASNVVQFRTGALNLGACKVSDGEKEPARLPANVIFDEAAARELNMRTSVEASRFFYVTKASRRERCAGLDGRNDHPTVKPVELMRYLVRLVTPPGGVVLDPFAGSGTTGIAATLEGARFIGIEREQDYIAIAEARIAYWKGEANAQVAA